MPPTCGERSPNMGWIGAAIPEEFGGAGLGYEGLCVLAEEMGRAVAPVPFGSTRLSGRRGDPDRRIGRAETRIVAEDSLTDR